MFNDLLPPLFALVVGAVPRPGLGPFLVKDPGPQGRRGGFHAIPENIGKALVAQHLLIVFAEHADIRHNHNSGDIETLFQRLNGYLQRMTLPCIARNNSYPTRQTLGGHHQCQHDLTAVMSTILAEALGQKATLLFVGLIVFAFRGKGQRRAIVEQHIHWSLQQFFRRRVRHPAHLVNHRRVEIIHAPVYRIQVERDARLIGQRLYRRTLVLRLRQAGQNQFPHDAVCALAPRPWKRVPAKLVIDRPHHIAEPRRQARLLAAITRINVQFFRTWGFANNFLKIGIFGGGNNSIRGV